MHHQRCSVQQNTCDPVCVQIRLMFLQIGNNTYTVNFKVYLNYLGSINTQLEQFDARIVIEARWLANDSILSLLDDDIREKLSQGQIIQLCDDFSEQKQNWHPKLFLLNTSINNYEEQFQYSLKKDENSDTSSPIYVREHRIVKGSFCIMFHLHHYPSDVQTLSVSIGSSLTDGKVKLVQHPTIASGINKEVFEGQQEWHLYEHVETQSRTVRGYFSLTDEDGELDKPGYEKERSVLTFSCHVGKQKCEAKKIKRCSTRSSSISKFHLEWLSYCFSFNCYSFQFICYYR
jgi:hypothetical protein